MDLQVMAIAGILAVAIGLLLVILSSNWGVKTMAQMRFIEVPAKRIDAHGEPTADVLFTAKAINGNVILEFEGERTSRYILPAAIWDRVKEL